MFFSSGDLTGLDVNFYTIKANMLTHDFVKRAHAVDREVWVWTVNSVVNLNEVMRYNIDGVITDYPMGFARYRQVKALEAQNKIDHTPKAVKEKTVTEKPKPNRSAQQARRQLTICEKEISAQETAIAEIEQRLEEAGGDYERYSEIYKEKEAAEQMLSELMEKWETLAEQAGE